MCAYILENLIRFLYHRNSTYIGITVSYCVIHNSTYRTPDGISHNLHTYPFKLRSFFNFIGGRRGRDHMVVGFTTTCAISAFHH